MSTYANGVTTVGTTATLICTVQDENDGVLIQNNGTSAVVLGGPSVTASGANMGVSLAAGATINVPSVGNRTHDLYGIVATGTAPVAWLLPLD